MIKKIIKEPIIRIWVKKYSESDDICILTKKISSENISSIEVYTINDYFENENIVSDEKYKESNYTTEN